MNTISTEEKSKLKTNSNLVLVQSKLFSSSFSGPGKWIVFNPDNKKSFLVQGKDILPELVTILTEASGAHFDYTNDSKIQKLIDAGLLDTDNDSNISTFLERYQKAVLNYPPRDYYDPKWRKKDQDRMDAYAKMWPQPPKITKRLGEKIPLPSVDKQDLSPNDENKIDLKKLSAILRYNFAPIGKINGQFGPNLRKTSPSGGAKHPTECVIALPNKLNNLNPGFYVYDVETHSLIKDEDYPNEALESLNNGSIGFIIRTRVERPMWRYREIRSFRAIFIDAGHIVENIMELSKLYGYASSIQKPILKENDTFSWLDEPEVATVVITPEGRSIPYIGEKHQNNTFENYSNKLSITNPAIYFTFEDNQIIANVEWPQQDKVNISYAEFNILSHCLPSRRGDRNTITQGIIESIDGVLPDNVKKLKETNCLLPRGLGINFYRRLDLWVKHSWYINFITHLEVRNNTEQIIPKIQQKDNVLTASNLDVLFNRHTTRRFSSEAISRPVFNEIMNKVFPLASMEDENLRVFISAQNVEGMEKGLYEFDTKDREYINLSKTLTSDEIRALTIGLEFAGTGALSVWVYKGIDLKSPGLYEIELMELGQIGQRLCLACTDLGLGIFQTPAITDSQTFDTLGIDNEVESLTYYFNIGEKPKRK